MRKQIWQHMTWEEKGKQKMEITKNEREIGDEKEIEKRKMKFQTDT